MWACEEWQKGACSWYFCSSWWDLKLNEALPQALQAVDSPWYYPSNVKFLLERVNETSKHRTGSAVVVYLQLTTKSRRDKFSRDACDDVASTLGAFARNITYDNAACPSKFILEVSVSGSPSSHSRFLPGFSMNMFMEKPGRNRGRLGKGWKGQSPPLHGRSRRNTSRTSSIHLNVKLWAPLPSWWSVVPKALGNQPCWTISCVSMWRMAKGCFLLKFLFVLVRLEAERGATPSVTSRRFALILPVKCQIFAGTGEWDVQAPNRQCRRGIPATHNQKPQRQI